MDENRGPEVIAVSAVFYSCAFITTALRVYVRGWVVKKFGWDDTLMVFTLMIYGLYISVLSRSVYWGFGKHVEAVTLDHLAKALRNWYVAAPSYVAGMISAKMSIGLFILRITTIRVYRWIIYIAIAASFIINLVYFFDSIFACWPVGYLWKQLTDPFAKGSCTEMTITMKVTYAYTAVCIVTDLIFAILPVFLVWEHGRHMPKRTKLALIPIFGLAAVASLAAVIRLVYIHNLSNFDILWSAVGFSQWTTTELGLAIIAGSLATLRPLFDKIVSKLGYNLDPVIPSRPSALPTPHVWNVGSTSGKLEKPRFFSRGNIFKGKIKGKDQQGPHEMGGVQSYQSKGAGTTEHKTTTTSDESEKQPTSWIDKAGDEESRLGIVTLDESSRPQTESQ